MKNQKGFIVPILLVIITLLVISGGVYIYKNKKAEVPVVEDATTQQQNSPAKNTPSLNSISNQTAVSQDPHSFLIQVKKDLKLSSEVQATNPDLNAYQLQYPKGEMSRMLTYLGDKSKRLWDRDGSVVFANGYMQCFVSPEAVACVSYFMESGGMRPTFAQGQVLITKNPNQIERGDVVIFAHITSEGVKTTFTKRIIGLPGETFKIENGLIYINNASLKKVGPLTIVEPQNVGQPEIKLMTGQYYVLGDFTQQSYDSRSFGPVNSSDILAKVVQ